MLKRMQTLFLAIGGVGILQAQEPAPSFEVASVKLHPLGEHMTFGIAISGSNVRIGGPVSRLIMEAYGVMSYQILEGPEWARSIDSDYDIVARTEGDTAATRAQVKRMLQTLLADRFQLRLRHDTQERQMLALIVDKNGLKIKESAPETSTSMRLGNGQVTATKLPISQLAISLSTLLKQPVVDKTGLKGLYDYALRWTPDEAPASDQNTPSLFTALQKQLGLKLQSQKNDLEVLIIDQVKRPSEN
jgi:uncharacterized protein (TIGR03435 family)